MFLFFNKLTAFKERPRHFKLVLLFILFYHLLVLIRFFLKLLPS